MGQEAGMEFGENPHDLPGMQYTIITRLFTVQIAWNFKCVLLTSYEDHKIWNIQNIFFIQPYDGYQIDAIWSKKRALVHFSPSQFSLPILHVKI